ncbi:MAG: adenosylcobinamide-phosphate synthase CbiB [gamma proteobacterium symbiont of Bathyaustriella thionipta]|nr:adenosylcobinamide-phosphate synthase CbiB [gamma proteobacterium symbiont of Bathyaustriella thionipta]MCU7949807.1 adenosylcobinamide-phosphate synthase CbiB [gamma proteobacterium symbiont of Bathyaustriella thionipta]MCU7951836.1 adenosylcobinamide-phosphate synthase CbiB [gamma proteobacterium symbiont of Bathyaustriella thionipta]MCU7956394.1 adenosylcobinamide-phosphate synthase CbiB [gamma proteobacterium symbiont of Bathyaustriella thionipta]MCU7968908.1 adenosylcobinamide-phosphate
MLIVLLCALLLDYFFGEPEKYHPLVAFGRFASYLEARLNEDLLDKKVGFNPDRKPQTMQQNRTNGLIAVLVCLVPAWWLTYVVISDGLFSMLLETVILYLALGLNSLKAHAREVLLPVQNEQLDQARHALSKIVSRDTREMDEEGICRATTESVLENGSDAVFATIFWFLVAGAPGVVVYRLSNTLDAMWGYKTQRYNHFGFFIAKFDDLLNFIPARLTALTYALMGNWKNAMRCWSKQGSLWESPNAGVVMAAGAGALGVQLGGADHYHGELKQRTDLGCGEKAQADTIHQACQLLDRSTILWAVVVALICVPAWL